MMMEAAVIAAVIIGAGLLAGLLNSAVRGDTDRVVLFGIAMLTGISSILGLIAAIVIAIVFGCKGDGAKAVSAVAGFVLGIVLFVGVIALVSAGIIEGGA